MPKVPHTLSRFASVMPVGLGLLLRPAIVISVAFLTIIFVLKSLRGWNVRSFALFTVNLEVGDHLMA